MTGQVYAADQKDDASKGGSDGAKGGDGDSKGEKPEGGKPDAPHAGQKQSDKHDIKGALSLALAGHASAVHAYAQKPAYTGPSALCSMSWWCLQDHWGDVARRSMQGQLNV